MNASIFAEGSRTTGNTSENLVAKEYFRGIFKPVSTLEEELSDHSTTKLHILSDDFGYLHGETPINPSLDTDKDAKEEIERFSDAIVSSAQEDDIIIILLSSEIFKEIVEHRWEDIISAVRGDSIWCLGASKSALESAEIPALKAEGATVLTYERVGVAPIGQDTRDQLLTLVRERT